MITNRAVAGVFDCDGYKAIVLNLAGEIKDPVPKGGKLGAILVPDVDPFTQAFQQPGLLPVTIEIELTLKPGARSAPASSPSAAADRERRGPIAPPSRGVRSRSSRCIRGSRDRRRTCRRAPRSRSTCGSRAPDR